MGPDLDYGEYFITIKDYFTKAPYVDSSGYTTLNLPYDECEIFDNMYEPKASDPSNARIVLPSLVTFPGLRSLLQKIKEGNRVEIYNFQPDCGDPIFAGFIGPNGISEEQGKLVLTIQDTLTQLRWQHIRKWEQFSTNAAGFYRRARRIWSDVVNEDFTSPTAASDYQVFNYGSWGNGLNAILSGFELGYWPLSDTSGTTAIDRGNAIVHNGTYTGTVTINVVGPWSDLTDVPPQIGSSRVATFDGATGYVNIPFAAALHPGDTFTVGCWFKTSAAVAQTLIDNGAGDFGVTLDATGHILITKVGASTLGTSTAAYNDGNWHFVVWTKATVTSHLYVDGVDVTPVITNAAIVASGTAPTRFGANQTPATFFNGTAARFFMANAITASADILSFFLAGAGVNVTWNQQSVTAQLPVGMEDVGQGIVTIAPKTGFNFDPFDTLLLEVDFVVNVTDWPASNAQSPIFEFGLRNPGLNFQQAPSLAGEFQWAGGGGNPYQQQAGMLVVDTSVPQSALIVTSNGDTVQANQLPMPQSHHSVLVLSFDASLFLTASFFIDGVLIDAQTSSAAFNPGSSAIYPFLLLFPTVNPATVSVSSWRVRKLTNAVLPAGRFSPQTVDTLPYSANNEENLQLLQLIADKDNAEYRPIYRAWPQIDELELDQSGTLGTYVSRQLAYDQPANLPTEGSPKVAPLPVIQDVATFVTPLGQIAPPFRFEEGYNLTDYPKVAPKQNAHANDIIRIGASTTEAQVQIEKWSTAETGRPQHGAAGAYPYFEAIVNDDRVPSNSLNQSLALTDLTRRIDPLPSIQLKVAAELAFTGRWRAGDFAFIKTQSLRSNYEQEMRIAQIHHTAGKAEREITMARTEFDPSLLGVLRNAEMISWLYDAAGTSPFYIPLAAASVAINAGASSADFTVNLDLISPNSLVVYAALHWFTSAGVLKVEPIINNISVTAPTTSPSDTDSGLVIVTGMFQSLGSTIGKYLIHFTNTDAVTRTLTSAFLILRVKG